MKKVAAKTDPSGSSAGARTDVHATLPGENPENRRIPTLRMEPTLRDLHGRLTAGTLELDRPWADSPWPPAQQARVVESVLLRVPLPAFFFLEGRDGRLHVIDGVRRLRALFAFLEGKLALSGLHLLPELNGQRFVDLRARLRRRFEDTTLLVTVVTSTNVELGHEIFMRLNHLPGDGETEKGADATCSPQSCSTASAASPSPPG